MSEDHRALIVLSEHHYHCIGTMKTAICELVGRVKKTQTIRSAYLTGIKPLHYHLSNRQLWRYRQKMKTQNKTKYHKQIQQITSLSTADLIKIHQYRIVWWRPAPLFTWKHHRTITCIAFRWVSMQEKLDSQSQISNAFLLLISLKSTSASHLASRHQVCILDIGVSDYYKEEKGCPGSLKGKLQETVKGRAVPHSALITHMFQISTTAISSL